MEVFDDRRPIGRPLSGKGVGGLPGMQFNTEQTCNPDGQCFQVVAGTAADREAYNRYQEYLRSQSKDVFETFGDALGEAAGFVKNVAAGVVNSVIPGSDLGDAGNPGQIVGALVGNVVGPGAIIGAATKAIKGVSALGAITGAIGKVAGVIQPVLASPIGNQVIGAVVQNLTAPRASQPVYQVPQASTLTWPPMMAGGTMTKPGLVIDTEKGTISKGSQGSMPTWLLPVAIVVAIGVALFAIFKRKRK